VLFQHGSILAYAHGALTIAKTADYVEEKVCRCGPRALTPLPRPVHKPKTINRWFRSTQCRRTAGHRTWLNGLRGARWRPSAVNAAVSACRSVVDQLGLREVAEGTEHVRKRERMW